MNRFLSSSSPLYSSPSIIGIASCSHSSFRPKLDSSPPRLLYILLLPEFSSMYKQISYPRTCQSVEVIVQELKGTNWLHVFQMKYTRTLVYPFGASSEYETRLKFGSLGQSSLLYASASCCRCLIPRA